MKHLLYGIARAEAAARARLPVGLDEAPLSAVEHGELAAILAPVEEPREASAGIEHAVQFARVVEQLHRRLPILPMRYGCFVHQPAQAAELLREHAAQFSEALDLVAGREEMGIRLLIEREHTRAEATSPSPTVSSGRAYLAARQSFYAQQARSQERAQQLAEEARTAFNGLFTRFTWEHVPRPEGDMVSLAFLVEREKVAEFRRAFLRFQHERQPRAMCSGPWPPWGFVTATELEHLLARKKG